MKSVLVLAALVLSCGGAAPSADSPPGGGERASSRPDWVQVAPYLDRVDAGDGIACFRARTGLDVPVGVSCVRVAPMPLPNLGTEPRVRRGR